MRIRDFQGINQSRHEAWHERNAWNYADLAIGLAGETGETCNVIKKLNRVRDGTKNPNGETVSELHAMLGEELADTVMYACLLATCANIDIETAIINKFNKTSKKLGIDITLEH